MTDTLPTARTTLRTGYVCVLVFCNSRRHQADADLQALACTAAAWHTRCLGGQR